MVLAKKSTRTHRAACGGRSSTEGALPAEAWAAMISSPLFTGSSRHLITDVPHTKAKQGKTGFPDEDLLHPFLNKTKQKQLGGFSIHICKWRLNCWIGASKPAWYSHALCNLESVQDSITVRDSSTYDSWWWALCEPLTQAEGRPCPFPAELHSPAAAKTLSACRELSFTDACEFSIASILRNWLYPVWRKQSKKHARRSAQGHIANLLESLKWRRDRAAGSFSFD